MPTFMFAAGALLMFMLALVLAALVGLIVDAIDDEDDDDDDDDDVVATFDVDGDDGPLLGPTAICVLFECSDWGRDDDI